MTDERPPMLHDVDNLRIGPAPVGDLLASGHADKRRRRTLISSVLASAVIVAGVSVATAGNSSPSQNTNVDGADQSDAPDPQPFPDPPTGNKWVGMNGVVVAVPAEWPVLSSPCGDGSPGVVLDGTKSAVTDCRQVDAQVASVTLTPLDVVDSEPADPSGCTWSNPGSCSGSATFRDQGVGINVVVHGDDAQEQVDRILDTATVLPDGWTTVPFGGEDRVNKRALVLESAGFKVDFSAVGYALIPVRSEPESGSPVREGATITLLPLSQEQESVASELTVTSRESDDPGLDEGLAEWDSQRQALDYMPLRSHGCPPDGSASTSVTTVALVLSGDKPCDAILRRIVVTIAGLTQAPTELTVTEDGKTRTVPVSPEEDPEKQELDVSLIVRASSDDSDLAPGSARWNEARRTVVYTTKAVYTGCPPVAARSNIVGSVLNLSLTKTRSIDPGFCSGFSASNAVFSISGLTDAPPELTVTENGETRTVPVEQKPETASTPAPGTCFPGGCDN